MAHEDSSQIWWGEHELSENQAARWQVGPLRVWLRRRSGEWLLAYDRSEERDDPTVRVESPVTDGEDSELPRTDPISLPDAAETLRLMARAPGVKFRVVPLLADRPVVTRPEGTYRILPRTEVSLFVSTPLWFRVEVDLDDGSVPMSLFEQAIVRPSDTWFGSTTRHGEMCYGSRTPAALTEEELPALPSRAITRVRISNRADDVLDLLRLALPAPSLSLWLDGERPELGLFTSSVKVERASDGVVARVEVDSRPPSHLQQAKSMSGPRHYQSRNMLARAMSSILS